MAENRRRELEGRALQRRCSTRSTPMLVDLELQQVMAQPHPNTNTLPIQVVGSSLDGARWTGPFTNYDPESWPLKVEELRALLNQTGRPLCPIRTMPIPDEHGASKEHIVHKATGIRWIKLPAGMVDDRVNNGASQDEGCLYHTGTMGFLRPMYATGKKKKSFEASNGDSVTVSNHHKRGFEITVRGGSGPGSAGPHSAGPGELAIRAVVDQPIPHRVSRALCKSAYLALCVHCPGLALRDEFADLREWLNTGGQDGHRPYGEKLLPGKFPGAEFKYHVLAKVTDAGKVEAVHQVTAFVRLHMIGYFVGLVGSPDLEALVSRDSEIHVFADPERGASVKRTTFTFGFDSATPSL